MYTDHVMHFNLAWPSSFSSEDCNLDQHWETGETYLMGITEAGVLMEIQSLR